MTFTGSPAKIPQLGFTHGGRFHADDVFSAALLRMMRPDIRIYRGFTVPIGFSGIVFDIGNGPFDHHQKGSPRRENGVPYASFGLLWKEYGHFFLSEAEALRFDEKFVQPLDLDDNTGSGNTLAGLIGAYNPPWDSDEDADKAFFEAVDIAQSLLEHKLESLAAVERGKKIVEDQLKKMKDGVVILQDYVPWKPVLVQSDAEFVVFPSMRGGYSLQCIPKDFNGKTGNKVPLPSGWWGRPEEELQKTTGVPDIKFCHASGFMATVGSVEGALQLCALAREENTRREAQRAADRAAAAKQTAEKTV
ncbi:MAG: MYG1 family protein [Oscillospiraceae bacterium]